ncbi:MAG: type I glyceraldehyde-3-phosphate dehydrogenase [Anaerolineae bacterium]
MPTRVAINGFGRIGRQVVKAVHERYWDDLDIVAVGITDPHITETRALLLKHDSVYGAFEADVEAIVKGRTNAIRVDDKQIDVVGRNPYGPVPEWRRWGIDLVLEASGYYRDKESAGKHLLAGARRVLITAPAKSPDATLVLGVNEADFDPGAHRIVSNASCTTNALAPPAKIVQERFGIERGLLSTIHSYTSSQVLLDHAKKNARRSRAAALNIVPTTTGAAKAVGEVIPELKGRFQGSALRVPTPTVSIADFTALVERPAGSEEEVNAVLREAASGPVRHVLGYTEEQLVSVDFVEDPHSSIVDAPATIVQGDLIKLVLWYDNEWGYASRVADMAFYMTQRAEGRSHQDVRAEMNERLDHGVGSTQGLSVQGVPA